ncbi:tumor necrosis factor ligand superfamily member 14 [Nerophis lumbriciformis]|uniref:tumor necrosis factor ligand superfamily member 14 n=1 Tax=Nerophis lumbriciformis TaxID=546530 RepID=UPI002AE0B232|nr:tumor necrosis factor ligand superfamily member 6-like [Nerophis lumbriciformis]
MRAPSSVYVIDGAPTAPPLPPRAGRPRKSGRLTQNILFLLVSVALIGLVLEAVLIFYLHPASPPKPTSASFSKLRAEQHEHFLSDTSKVSRSKPVACLIDGQDVVHGQQILGWSLIPRPVLHKMHYVQGDRSLVVQKEGHYFVYSKVYFEDVSVFSHSVVVLTRRHGELIPLMQSRKYSRKYSTKTKEDSNSFLGGVFHLRQDDALFVKVSNSSNIIRHKAYENIFGAFMI